MLQECECESIISGLTPTDVCQVCNGVSGNWPWSSLSISPAASHEALLILYQLVN